MNATRFAIKAFEEYGLAWGSYCLAGFNLPLAVGVYTGLKLIGV